MDITGDINRSYPVCSDGTVIEEAARPTLRFVKGTLVLVCFCVRSICVVLKDERDVMSSLISAHRVCLADDYCVMGTPPRSLRVV